MSQNPNDFAEQIDRMANGYRDAQVLLTANRLGIFPLLEESPQTVPEMAKALGATVRALQILCDALVAVRLLRKTGDRYENSDAARHCLLPSSPAPRTAILLHNARLYARWGKLYQVAKSGRPVSDDQIDPDLSSTEADFARAMADSARGVMRVTADALVLGRATRLLDVGGGPGLYSIEFARRYPQLHCVIMDNEATLRITRQNISQAGLEDRVTTLPGDALEDDLRGPYDIIFVSNLIHSFSFNQNAMLIRKCAENLNARGLLCVKDFFLEPDRTSPVWAALFAVNMLVNTEKGNCYTVAEVSSWLEKAGLVVDPVRMITPQTGLLTGRKEP
ncbi:MAG: methyltransferase domain-containing protein [Acidobacteria bacterium]|nr:MAG: methyltransferase domain-containing protein [Acidobacteriota bacterium]